MSEKSHVTLEHAQCPICLKVFETGGILLDKRLKNSLEKVTVTHYATCEEHTKEIAEGFIFLIEMTNSTDRTGKFARISGEMFPKLFDTQPPKKGIALCDTETFTLLEKLINEEH